MPVRSISDGPATQPNPPAPAEASPSAAGAPSRRRLWVIGTITALWLLGGALLALLTANPVTLNAEQIERADLVVTGTVSESGEVTVDREWKRGLALDTVQVRNLPEASAQAGSRLIIPLTVNDGSGYRVTITRLEHARYLVYPATDSALRQLQELLPPRNRAATAAE